MEKTETEQQKHNKRCKKKHVPKIYHQKICRHACNRSRSTASFVAVRNVKLTMCWEQYKPGYLFVRACLLHTDLIWQPTHVENKT